MKTIKILAVLAVLTGLVIAGFVLLTPKTEHRRSSRTAAQTVTVETIPDVAGEEGAVIGEYVALFSSGWNDTAYENAKSYIAHPDRQSSVDQMEDLLTSGIMRKMDSVVTDVYRSNPRQMPTSSHPVLGPCYRGLTRLAADFPVVATRGSYARLNDDRELYDGIHAFSTATFAQSPCFNLRLVPSASGWSLDWQETLHDYGALRQVQDARRRNLQSRLDRNDDLRGISWLAPALAERRFNDRITNAETTYRNAERGQFMATLRSLPSDRRLSSDAAASRAVAEQLTALEANLPAMLYSAETAQAIRDVRRRLSSVTAGPITR